jgi:hypothetical protein
MVELALQSRKEIAKEMPVLFLLAGLASPPRKPPISGTIAKKIIISYEGKIRKWKLGKRNDPTLNPLVQGSSARSVT